MLRSWKREGYTDFDISQKIGIDEVTLVNWKKKSEKITEALSKSKEFVDFQVENALLKAALGYRSKEIIVTLGAQTKNGNMYQVMREEKEKEIGPNATACIMWLNNRKPDQWKRNRDKWEDEKEDRNNNFTITIERGAGFAEDDGINHKVTVSTKPAEDDWDSIDDDGNLIVGSVDDG